MSDAAIPAATLILVRELAGGGPPQLLMVERAGGMAFAAGALVFPGGRIDAADRDLGATLDVAAATVAAIRETIEETAVPAALFPAIPLVLLRQLARLRPVAIIGDRFFGSARDGLGLAADRARE